MKKDLLSELTVVILTYRTNREVLSNCLNSLDEEVKIKIIENSEHFENENEFINKYSNLTIECTGKNLGFGGGNNFGFKKINTKFVLALSPDTICDKNFFENIKSYLKDSLEFSLIGVSYYQNEPFPTYGYFDKSKKIETSIDSLVEVDWIAGCAMLINLDKYEFTHSAVTSFKSTFVYSNSKPLLSSRIAKTKSKEFNQRVPNINYEKLPASDILLMDIEGEEINIDLDKISFDYCILETNTEQATNKIIKDYMSRAKRFKIIKNHKLTKDKNLFFIRKKI